MSQYALAGDVLDAVTLGSGECDRVKALGILNRIRERLYQMFPSIPLFDISMVFDLQSFCADANDCAPSYRGVTLPRAFQSVEAMWLQSMPITLYTSWREWQRGMAPECFCGLAKYDLPDLYSSERDILPGRPVKLSVYAENGADVGKRAAIIGTDVFGARRTYEFILTHEPQFTENAMRSIDRGRGFIKTRTVGRVILSDENSRVLSAYEPDETVPGYRRIKITGMRDDCSQVNIRGNRRYFPVYAEGDLIETDNRTAFEEMARFLKINDKVNKDANDMRSAAAALAQAKEALKGDRSRELGKSTDGVVSVALPCFQHHALGFGYYG